MSVSQAPESSRPVPNVESTSTNVDSVAVIARSHLRFGWWTLLVFLTTGMVLEVFHGWKVPWYVDVGNETRRLMFTLGHAHGTLLSLVNIGLGCTLLALRVGGRWTGVSRCLTAASLLIPGGFFLGGIVIHSGDPGIGILLLPVGALLLLISVFMTARRISAD